MSAESALDGDSEPNRDRGATHAARWLAVLLDVTADGRVFLHVDRPGARSQSHVFRTGADLGAFVATLLAAQLEPNDAALTALRDAAQTIARRLPDGDSNRDSSPVAS